MNIDILRCGLAAVAAIALSGCMADDLGLGNASDLGEATRQTLAAQVIDPLPEYASELVTQGDQVAAANRRYATDKVKQPDRTATSTLSSNSAGAGK